MHSFLLLVIISRKVQTLIFLSPFIPSREEGKSFWQDDAQHDQERPLSFMNKLEMKVSLIPLHFYGGTSS